MSRNHTSEVGNATADQQTEREGSREAKNPTQGVKALVEALTDVTRDWDGSDLPDASEPRTPVSCFFFRQAAQALTNQAEYIKTLETALRDCIDVLDIADAYGFYAPGSLGAADVKDTRDQARQALSALQGGDHAG